MVHGISQTPKNQMSGFSKKTTTASKFIYEDINAVDNPSRIEDGSEGTDVFFSPLSEQMMKHGRMMSDSMNRSDRYLLSTP